MKLKFLSVGVALMAIFASCTKGPEVDPEEDGVEPNTEFHDVTLIPRKDVKLTNTQKDIAYFQNLFAFESFNAVANEYKHENLFVSSYSLSQILAILANGANEEAKSELIDKLQMSEYSLEEINGFYKTMNKALGEIDPSVTAQSPNGLWVTNSATLNTEFSQLLRENFNSEISAVDFTNSQSLSTINNWVKAKTDGKIPQLYNSLDPNSLMVMANCLNFKGYWTGCFAPNKTKARDFTNADGSKVKAQMMWRKDSILALQVNDVMLAKLPYGNKAFEMVLAMPANASTSVDAMLAGHDKRFWHFAGSELTTKETAYEVELNMPRFTIENELKLNDVLKAMGISKVFNDNSLTKIIEAAISISEMKQKSVITVNEGGVDASAVTSVHWVGGVFDGVPTTTYLKSFNANRPFAFFIREKSTETILFMGKVENLKED